MTMTNQDQTLSDRTPELPPGPPCWHRLDLDPVSSWPLRSQWPVDASFGDVDETGATIGHWRRLEGMRREVAGFRRGGGRAGGRALALLILPFEFIFWHKEKTQCGNFRSPFVNRPFDIVMGRYLEEREHFTCKSRPWVNFYKFTLASGYSFIFPSFFFLFSQRRRIRTSFAAGITTISLCLLV